ncbi:MAG TPA: response regulator [Dehalococcoidia bacterium]|nr:response regulator [Dehalococcoidia bacterium]
MGMREKSILLVEDNLDIQAFVRTIARLEGANLRIAASGEEALALLDEAVEFHLILLDLNLPDVSGWDVLAKAGSSSRCATTPVVIFSAHIDAATRERAQALGASGFLPKPIGAREFVEALNSYLR